MAKKEIKKKKKVPRSTQQSIPYELVYDNGVIETEPGVFTRAYPLEDVNFKLANEDKQLEIYHRYKDLLNSIPTDARFQIVIMNKTVKKEKFLQDIYFQGQDDDLNEFRQQMNKLLIQKIAAGKSNRRREKYLVVSIKDKSVEHAMQVLNSLDSTIGAALKDITGHDTSPLTTEERLRTLYDIYHQDDDYAFENTIDENGEPKFDIYANFAQGLSTKDMIAPSGMSFHANYFTLGDTFGRSFYLERVAYQLSTRYLEKLSDLNYNILISLQFEPIKASKATRMVKERVMALNGQLSEAEKRAVQEGYSTGTISPELENARDQAKELLNDITNRDQHLFSGTVTVTVFGNSMQEIEDATREVTAIADEATTPLRKLFYQQEFGLTNSLPLCVNKLYAKRNYTSEEASIFLPYTAQDLRQKYGICYGLNDITKAPIVYTRLSGQNYNGLVFGSSGSGKSFFTKHEILSTRLKDPNARIYIIDPEMEYVPLVKGLGGEVINFSTNEMENFLNPMDITFAGNENPIPLKTDYIISMIEIMYNGHKIEPRERSIIDRCVTRLYQEYAAYLEDNRLTGDKKQMPTLRKLYHELLRQPEQEAKGLAATIEIYAVGSMSLFSHHSTIETNAEIVDYNINGLGGGMKELGLFICLNDIWNKMIENQAQGLWTWIYIDEFYLLLRTDSTVNFLSEVWKRARKWRGVPTGIMQNVGDILRNPATRDILNLTSFLGLVNTETMDREAFADLLNLSERQVEYISGKAPGYGLIYTGQTVIPFQNRIDPENPIFEYLRSNK